MNRRIATIASAFALALGLAGIAAGTASADTTYPVVVASPPAPFDVWGNVSWAPVHTFSPGFSQTNANGCMTFSVKTIWVNGGRAGQSGYNTFLVIHNNVRNKDVFVSDQGLGQVGLGANLRFEADGNLDGYYYDIPANAWQSDSHTTDPNVRLVFQWDGNLVIYPNNQAKAIWSTHTNSTDCTKPAWVS